MPELPEVETVRLGLVNRIVGRRIKSIEVLHQRANRATSYLDLDAVTGARIIEVRRIGKFLWFVLDRDFALVGHLGMSGQMIIQDRKIEPHRHLRARMDIGGREEFRFIDQRTFGWLAIDRLVDTSRGVLPESCSHIAPDVFSEDFDRNAVIADIKRRKTEIKRAILNQEIISGIGNIYADEALWYARIHPERQAWRLSEKEIATILSAAKKVMARALRKGGTSFDDLYVNVNGESGYFEVSLKAYGREGEPCHRCGGQIRRISFANRSSHFCPKCQPRPAKSQGNPGRNSARRGG
jgi:formamidopyrimidine-DNA glycosylase